MKKHCISFPWFWFFFACVIVSPISAYAEKIHCPAVTDDNDKNTEIARKYFSMGGMYFSSKNYLQAAESFECVLRFVPYSLNARYKLAQSYDAAGVYSRAREHYTLILAYKSAEAEAIKDEVRKRIEAIQHLKDQVQFTGTTQEPPSHTSDNACPDVVVKNQKDVLIKVQKALQDKNWVSARTLLEAHFRSLDGATPAQRKLCLSLDSGVDVMLYMGIVHFRMGNIYESREWFEQSLQTRPTVDLPAVYTDATLLAFFQKVSTDYFARVNTEKARQLRLRQLEASGKIPPEPAENPSEPVEHSVPQNVVRGEDLVFFCRVQDSLKVARVVLVVRFDDQSAQEEIMEKMGQRRYVTVLPGVRVQFRKMTYHIEVRDAAGNEIASWGRKNPQVIELALDKKEPTPSDTSTTPSDVGANGSTGTSMPSNPGSTKSNATMNSLRVSERDWRIFVSTALGRQYLGVPKGTVTERNAEIQTFGFVPNDLSFATEIGFLWGQKNRVSAGVLYNMVNKVSYDNAPTQRSGEMQYFGRYARYLGVGMFRPYVGGGWYRRCCSWQGGYQLGSRRKSY